MTALERVRQVRRALRIVLLGRALAWGVLATVLGLLGLAVVDLVTPLEHGTRVVARSALVVAVLLLVAIPARRAWRATGLASVALWIEGAVPELRYALLAALETPDVTRRGALERALAVTPWELTVRRRLRRAALPALLAPVVAAAALLAMPRGSTARVVAPRPGDALARTLVGDTPRDPLRPLVVDVIPPAYARVPRVTLEDPSSVTGLTGSRVVVRGRWFGGAEVVGMLEERATRALLDREGGRAGEWRLALPMPTRAAIVWLTHGNVRRAVALEPVADLPPRVSLTAPARDTVLREARGSIPLAAEASDDLGLGTTAFEVIVSSGEGETFTFRTVMLASARLDGARRHRYAARLALDALALKPGDFVHVRALARDRNPRVGLALGTSETRTIRVARAGEYDSVAVEGAAPPTADSSVVSQRMLLMLTEALEKRRASLERRGEQATVRREARRIGVDQKRLRRQVGDIVFMRMGGAGHSHDDGHDHAAGVPAGPLTPENVLAMADKATGASIAEALEATGDESPVIAINKPLLEAYNAMWEAAMALDQGEPPQAIPPMRRALAAIQRARQAERIYLRGRPPEAVVDLAKVRLTGKDKGASAERVARSRVGAAAHARRTRFLRLLTLLEQPRHGAAVADSLLLLRIDALGDPEANRLLADALGAASEALRAGRDGTAALVYARRLLDTGRARAGAPSAWSSWEATP